MEYKIDLSGLYELVLKIPSSIVMLNMHAKQNGFLGLAAKKLQDKFVHLLKQSRNLIDANDS